MAFRTMIRSILYGKPIIIVSGLPRSGTSMLMKMCESAGIEIVSDGIREADEDNPKGYYELERVKELDKNTDKSWLKELRGKAVKIISFLLRDLPATNNYKVLFMVRHLDEILASQSKMLERRNESSGDISDEQMKEHFENHLFRVKYLLQHSDHFDVLYLEHKDMIAKPREQAERISRFLGEQFDLDSMAAVVDRKLYRNRAETLKK